MKIDTSLARRVLDAFDGTVSPAAVWDHPGFDVLRTHAALLGRELTREQVAESIDGTADPVGGFERVEERREEITRLLKRVRDRQSAWRDEIETALDRVAPAADDVTLYVGIGYSVGVGTGAGAYLNLAAPLFERRPHELLYTAIHESTHVAHEQCHGVIEGLGRPAGTDTDDRTVWDAVFQTEAFATYAPLARRRERGHVESDPPDHPIPADYAVLSDRGRMTELVERYDTIRERLRTESVPRDRLLSWLFGGRRIPYRVGCAMVDAVERRDGLAGVRAAFDTPPDQFASAYDWTLDDYRG